jgi:hypothetical protein
VAQRKAILAAAATDDGFFQPEMMPEQKNGVQAAPERNNIALEQPEGCFPARRIDSFASLGMTVEDSK